MLSNYLKIALKVLLRRKFFTVVSLFGISFTLVVLVVATAVIDHICAPMYPEYKLNRMLFLSRVEIRGPENTRIGGAGYGLLNRYARAMPGVERATFFTTGSPAISYLNGSKVTSVMRYTDGEYWRVLDFNFLEGRPITEEDNRDVNFVAVINQATRAFLR